MPLFHMISDGSRPVARFGPALRAAGGGLPTAPIPPNAAARLLAGITAQATRVKTRLGQIPLGILRHAMPEAGA